MSAPVITVRSETTVKDALTLLTENGFTALPVVDTEARLLGIVTEADLIHDRVLRDPRDSRGVVDAGRHDSALDTVGAVMTSPAVAMGSGTDLTDLCQMLVDARIRAMPIVEGDKVVGIVTRGDIVRVLARDDRSIAADVRHRLESYGGLNRWNVEVHDGVVRIVDAFDSDTDRHVATVLARAVPGVVHAGTVSTASSGNGRAR
jgi:CBS domain-containing protein